MASIKIQRVQEQIRQKAATILFRDVSDPRLRLVTITRVEVSRDLAVATVYWSSLEDGAQRRTIERGLEDARGWVQREIARMLTTRTTPTIEWRFDKAIEGMARMSRLIREARQEDDQRARERGELLPGDEEVEESDDEATDEPTEPR